MQFPPPLTFQNPICTSQVALATSFDLLESFHLLWVSGRRSQWDCWVALISHALYHGLWRTGSTEEETEFGGGKKKTKKTEALVMATVSYAQTYGSHESKSFLIQCYTKVLYLQATGKSHHVTVEPILKKYSLALPQNSFPTYLSWKTARKSQF